MIAVQVDCYQFKVEVFFDEGDPHAAGIGGNWGVVKFHDDCGGCSENEVLRIELSRAAENI